MDDRRLEKRDYLLSNLSDFIREMEYYRSHQKTLVGKKVVIYSLHSGKDEGKGRVY
jgi:hypothetical protein